MTINVTGLRSNTHIDNDCERTEFYPKNYIFVNGSVQYTNDGESHTASICIMKINKTKFSTTDSIIVDGTNNCRQLYYSSDAQLLANINETLEQEMVLVSIALEIEPSVFKTCSYVSKIETVSSIYGTSFINTIAGHLDALIRE